jgi:hypothetical protein
MGFQGMGGAGPVSTSKRVKSLIFILLLLAGCTPNTALPELDADTLYHWGDQREDLEERYGKGIVVWVADTIPDDPFAAANVRAMVSSGKPRPSYYEIFLRKNLGPGGDYYRDYVFFNDLNRVVYAVRRQPLKDQPK